MNAREERVGRQWHVVWSSGSMGDLVSAALVGFPAASLTHLGQVTLRLLLFGTRSGTVAH